MSISPISRRSNPPVRQTPSPPRSEMRDRTSELSSRRADSTVFSAESRQVDGIYQYSPRTNLAAAYGDFLNGKDVTEKGAPYQSRYEGTTGDDNLSIGRQRMERPDERIIYNAGQGNNSLEVRVGPNQIMRGKLGIDVNGGDGTLRAFVPEAGGRTTAFYKDGELLCSGGTGRSSGTAGGEVEVRIQNQEGPLVIEGNQDGFLRCDPNRMRHLGDDRWLYDPISNRQENHQPWVLRPKPDSPLFQGW